mmetsp:Transcript_29636/g.87687  ORF Transcript_29636/g.87687 Transcript_29636/m.87687 type:complete len:263 (+) Transcript_29636:1471-2259(+)
MAVIGRGRRGGRAHRVRVAQLPPAQRLGTRRHVVCMARGLECREHLRCLAAAGAAPHVMQQRARRPATPLAVHDDAVGRHAWLAMPPSQLCRQQRIPRKLPREGATGKAADVCHFTRQHLGGEHAYLGCVEQQHAAAGHQQHLRPSQQKVRLVRVMPERERDAANRHCARHAGLKQQRLAHGGVQVVAAEDARAAKRARQPAARRAAVGDRPRLPHSVVDARCHLGGGREHAGHRSRHSTHQALAEPREEARHAGLGALVRF